MPTGPVTGPPAVPVADTGDPMTTTIQAPATKRPARPFLPKVPPPPVHRLTSFGSKAKLIGTFAAAYVLQFGLGVLTAVAVFVIRQDGELEEQVYTSSGYVLTFLFFGLIPFALSMTVIAVYRYRAHWSWSELGITHVPRDWFERRLWWRSSIVYLAALMVSVIVMGLLSGLRGSGDYPEAEGADLVRALSIVPQSLMAGIGEELLLVAFLVVAMERLGANGPTIYVVAVVLRIAFHLYYGPPVMGLVIWALVAVWIFRRTRTVMPLIIVHTLWDVNALSSEFVPIVTGLIMLTTLGAIVVTGIVHLATRRAPDPFEVPAAQQWTGPPPTPALPAPGWYLDPVDPRLWRWWDGYAWTWHTRG